MRSASRSSRFLRLPLTGLPVVLAALLASGCAKGAPTTDAGPVVSSSPSPTVKPCPPRSVPPQRWPIEVPADLPRPPGALITKVDQTNGVTIIRFSTADSLRAAVIFVVTEFRKTGFVLGRGDAEPAEADAPFTRGDFRGVYRMVATGVCSTTWLLAVAPPKSGPGGGPNLPNYHATSSASPLPFG